MCRAAALKTRAVGFGRKIPDRPPAVNAAVGAGAEFPAIRRLGRMAAGHHSPDQSTCRQAKMWAARPETLLRETPKP